MASLVTATARRHQLSRCALILAICAAPFVVRTPAVVSASAQPSSDARLLVVIDQTSLAQPDARPAARAVERLIARLGVTDPAGVQRVVVANAQATSTDAFDMSLAGSDGFSDDWLRGLGLSLDTALEVLRGNESVASELAARPCPAEARRRGVCGGNVRKQAEAAVDRYQQLAERTLRTLAAAIADSCGELVPKPLIVIATTGFAYQRPPEKAFRDVKKAASACKGASIAVVRFARQPALTQRATDEAGRGDRAARADPAETPAAPEAADARRRAAGAAALATAIGATLHDLRLPVVTLRGATAVLPDSPDAVDALAADLQAAAQALMPRLPAARTTSAAADTPSTTTGHDARHDEVDAKLPEIVRRASSYVATFVARAAVLLATEVYEQEVRAATNLTTLDAPIGALIERRAIESEIALVQVDDEEVWLMARDIVSVDGRPLDARERQPLTAVHAATRKEAMRQFKALANQGARFNIGSDSVTRNINMPTLALWFLSPTMRGRFAFGDAGDETIDGTRCRIVAFKERRKPYLMQVSGRQSPAAGRFWIRPDGIVLRTELRMIDANGDRPDGGARITVSYAFSDAVEAWVPRTMEERYLNPSGLNAGVIVAKASYRDFKQFLVDTKVTFPK